MTDLSIPTFWEARNCNYQLYPGGYMSKNVEDLLRMAYGVAQGSPDPSTQNGALLVGAGWTLEDYGDVLASGCNTFTTGVSATPERLERPLKYSYIEHAERNCIYDAANRGVAVNGLTMICPWAACMECARAIVQAGVRRLVRHKNCADQIHAGGPPPERWLESIRLADGILLDGGVEIVDYEGFLDGPSIRHSEKIWTP